MGNETVPIEAVTYWATVAQVQAALAIALVLEARLALRFRRSPYGIADIIQVLLFGIPLSVIATTLPFAVEGTLPGAMVPGWLHGAASLSIGLAVGSVVGSPALDLLGRAMARPLAIGLTRHPLRWLRTYRVRRRTEKILQQTIYVNRRTKELTGLANKKLEGNKADRETNLKRSRAVREALEEGRIPEDKRKVAEEYLEKTINFEQWVSARIAKAEQLLNAAPPLPSQEEAGKLVTEARDLSSSLREMRKEEANLLRSYFESQGLLGRPIQPDELEQEVQPKNASETPAAVKNAASKIRWMSRSARAPRR